MKRLSTFPTLTSIGLLIAGCSSSDNNDGAGSGEGGADSIVIAPGAGTGGNFGTGLTGTEGMVPIPKGTLETLRESACAGWNAEPEPLSSVLMLVVDTSQSMTLSPEGRRLSLDASGTKWAITRDALGEALNGLPGGTGAGLLLFPNKPPDSERGFRQEVSPDACVNDDELIPVALLGDAQSQHRARLDTILQTASPNYGTPTHPAFVIAQEEMSQTSVPGKRFMVLITDGQPTYGEGCVGDGRANTARPEYRTAVLEAVSDAHEDGIGTFVIGSPGSERLNTGEDARPWLSEAAQRGGTGSPDCSKEGPEFCHFDMSTETDFSVGLRNALGSIADQIVSCEYSLPQPPEGQTLEPGDVNVVYTKADGSQHLLLGSTSPECKEGWYYSADNSQVLLCEDSCKLVKADPSAHLEVLFGCSDELNDIVR